MHHTRYLLPLWAILLFTAHGKTMAAEQGTLKILTEPGEAKIYINGKRKGTSPAQKGQTFAIKLPEGEYVVKAEKADGAEHIYRGEKEAFVATDTLQTLTIKLTREETPAGKVAREERERKERKEREAEKMARLKKIGMDQNKIKAVLSTIEASMVVIPAGSFQMGCVSGKQCENNEQPVHTVKVPTFEMGATEVSFEQWDSCYAAGGCDHYPDDQGWGRGNRPVINVSFDYIQQYLKWLNQATGKDYRLPSEAQWEYAARGGTTTAYWWGDDVGKNNANCDGCGSQWDNKQTAPVASFKANPFGLFDTAGNVWEWTQDCWNDSYKGAPNNGSARQDGDCSQRVFRGGSWLDYAWWMRAAYRYRNSRDYRSNDLGFRLSRDTRR